MPFGRKSPLEALALPGVILAYKYSQFRQRRREAANRRVTERELSALHHKIDKLLSKLEGSEPDPPTSQEDECVICINARATMQTSPCGHRVVCRRCFVKTIQSAVAQRLLPLRCVICRARVNRLTSSSGTWRIQESASSYSMGAKSWASAGVTAGGVPASASSYSMNDAHSGHHAFHAAALHARYPRSPNGVARVAQSDSLYSMSSTGSSTFSGVSHLSAYSKTSSISSGLCSPASPISPSANSYASATILNNHLAPPATPSISHSSTTSPTSTTSGISLSPRSDSHHSHSHHAGCPSGCSGAIPRKPLKTLGNSVSSSSQGSASSSSSSSGVGSGGGVGGGRVSANSCSTSSFSFPPSTHTYPGRRHTKGRLVDLQNRLPPIKEFRSPAKVPHPSPVHISNPRFRYASYTKSSSAHEMAPLLREPPSPPKRPMNIHITTSLTTLGPPPLKAGGAKISPMTNKNSLPKNAYLLPKDKKAGNSSAGTAHSKSLASVNGKCGSNGAAAAIAAHANSNSSNNNTRANSAASNKNKKGCHAIANASCASAGAAAATTTTNSTKTKTGNTKTAAAGAAAGTTTKSNGTTAATACGNDSSRSNGQSTSCNMATTKKAQTSSSIRSGFQLFTNSSSNQKEKSDNKKNETMERKKKEDKLKLKAEKEARKEEKRMAKEEERLAKLIAKEEKKKGKKEAKELLLANDGNNKK